MIHIDGIYVWLYKENAYSVPKHRFSSVWYRRWCQYVELHIYWMLANYRIPTGKHCSNLVLFLELVIGEDKCIEFSCQR